MILRTDLFCRYHYEVTGTDQHPKGGCFPCAIFGQIELEPFYPINLIVYDFVAILTLVCKLSIGLKRIS